MFERRFKAAPRPDGWNQELLSELLGKSRADDELTNYLFLITRVQREVELIDHGTVGKVKFYGRIGSAEDSPLRFVRVIVHTLDSVDELKRATGYRENLPPLAKGYISLSTQGELYGQLSTPTLSVNVVGGKPLESELINSLSVTKQFGNAYLPLWIWTRVGAMRSRSAADVVEWKSENFLLIERCCIQQALDLHSAVAQDDMLF